jgi:hypothetical protein
MFMKIVKRASLLIIAMISILGISGCMNWNFNHEDRAEIAKELLKKKYKEDFTIFTSGEGYGSLTGNTFKVVAAPTRDKSLKFEATVHNEGAYIIDEYVQALMEKQMDQLVSDKAKDLAGHFFVKTYIDYDDIKFTNRESVSLEKYIQQKPNVNIVITLILDKDSLKNTDPEKEYEALADLFANTLPLDGALDLYFANSDIVQKSKEYFNKNAESYDDFEKMMSTSLNILIGITEGNLTISTSEYIQKRQVK